METKREKNIKLKENSRFTWTSSSAKTLGIIFSNDNTTFIANNITPKILDFKKGELGKNKNKKLQIETKNWNTITHHVFNLLEVS